MIAIPALVVISVVLPGDMITLVAAAATRAAVKSPLYHINSKPVDGEKDGYVFRMGEVGLGHTTIMTTLRLGNRRDLCRDYIATN